MDFTEIGVRRDLETSYAVEAWCLTCTASTEAGTVFVAHGVTNLQILVSAARTHLAGHKPGRHLSIVPPLAVALDTPETRCPNCNNDFHTCNADGCAATKAPGWRGWPVPEENR